MIFFFRIVSILEGLSYIVLLFFAVPIKYLAGNEIYVKFLGLPHGVLFILYIMLACIIQLKNIPLKSPNLSKINPLKFTWKAIPFCFVLLSSVIPFGTFYIDKKYLGKLKN